MSRGLWPDHGDRASSVLPASGSRLRALALSGLANETVGSSWEADPVLTFPCPCGLQCFTGRRVMSSEERHSVLAASQMRQGHQFLGTLGGPCVQDKTASPRRPAHLARQLPISLGEPRIQ